MTKQQQQQYYPTPEEVLAKLLATRDLGQDIDTLVVKADSTPSGQIYVKSDLERLAVIAAATDKPEQLDEPQIPVTGKPPVFSPHKYVDPKGW